MARRTIAVDYLARVEGEGSFKVVVRDGVVSAAELRIFEPPRFFEALLRGRAAAEAPDITARICGICPVAYQLSAAQAVEDALGVHVSEPVRLLRRLLHCGEWIQSHALHVHLLHAPDFLGHEGAITMAGEHGDVVRRGLALKQAGNELVALLGGRAIHPINVRVGGFHRVPRRRELGGVAETLKRAREDARETVRWAGSLDFPACERDVVLVGLRHPDEYPLNDGRIVSSAGLDVAPSAWEDHFEETQVSRSTALRSRLRDGGTYLVGPLARYALDFERLSPLAREAAREAGLGPVCRNPFQSIVVRALEVLYACDEALRLIDAYDEPDVPAVAVEPRAGVGFGATEAPRGLLWHRYRLAEDGTIAEARIVPPTAQNQASIEEDLERCVGGWLDLPDAEVRRRCEQTIRNYDPCISCATHFLRVEIERGP